MHAPSITKRHIASLVNNEWEIAMLFLSYWEMNENFTPKDVAKLAAELMEKDLWPVEGAKMLGWYITSDVPH